MMSDNTSSATIKGGIKATSINTLVTCKAAARSTTSPSKYIDETSVQHVQINAGQLITDTGQTQDVSNPPNPGLTQVPVVITARRTRVLRRRDRDRRLAERERRRQLLARGQ